VSKKELDNLVAIKQLKVEPGTRDEFDGLVSSGEKRLADAENEDLSTDSQFDLAYNAAHALALAALRQNGYRPEKNRFVVFQALVHTIGSSAADVQIFSRCHNERNLAEYEGRTEVDEQLMKDLIRCAKTLKAAVKKLAPPADPVTTS
jgi:uncharacterized protein (UPF0332 family)